MKNPLNKKNEFIKMPPSYSKDELLRCAEVGIYGVGTAKLPKPPMLMIDRIITITKDGGKYNHGYIHAELDISKDLWFFDCHFKDDPVMPGCLGLDAMWQLLGFFLGWSGHIGYGRALGAGKVKFTGMVLQHVKIVSYQIDIRKVIARNSVLGIGEGKVFADNNLIYQAADLRCGLFSPKNLVNTNDK